MHDPTFAFGWLLRIVFVRIYAFRVYQLVDLLWVCVDRSVSVFSARLRFRSIDDVENQKKYASTVTCRFKPKEFNSGPFPKIKGECLFCLSKLDVLLITQNVKQPDLSIRNWLLQYTTAEITFQALYRKCLQHLTWVEGVVLESLLQEIHILPTISNAIEHPRHWVRTDEH
ncbi:hypothetical protein ACTXT7_002838 [Hymenolepis weldensis]